MYRLLGSAPRFFFASLPLVASLLLGACSGDDNKGGSATTSSASSDSSTSSDSSSSTTGESSSTTGESSSTTGETTGEPATLTVFGIARVMPGTGKFVSQGEVCFVRPDQAIGPCTTTNTIGRFTLAGVPAETQGAITFKEDQIVTFAWALRTEGEDMELGLAIDTPALVQSYYETAGLARAEGRVVVLTEVYPPVAGYSATLEPTSGEGPFYYKTGAGELDLEATESNDAAAMAVFLNVDPALAPFSAPMAKGGVVCEATTNGATFAETFVPEGADILYIQRTCP